MKKLKIISYNNENFLIWKKRWNERLKLNNNTSEKYLKLMKSVNPLVFQEITK